MLMFWRKLSVKKLRFPVGKKLAVLAAGIFVVLGGGTVAVVSGHPGVLRYIPGISALVENITEDKAAGEEDTKPSKDTSADTAAKKSSSPSPSTQGGPVTVDGNVYGAPIGHPNEVGGMSSPSTKPLIISKPSISIPLGLTGGPITITAPESYPICIISSYNTPGGVFPAYKTPQPCGMSQQIIIDGARTPGTYNLHIFAQTRDQINGKYKRYDGYIKVTVSTTMKPDWSISAGPVQYQRDAGGNVNKITVVVYLNRVDGWQTWLSDYYPTGVYVACQGASGPSFVPTGTDVYTYTCIPTEASPRDFTLGFEFRAGDQSVRTTSVNVSY
jgi:hypothetical protein